MSKEQNKAEEIVRDFRDQIIRGTALQLLSCFLDRLHSEGSQPQAVRILRIYREAQVTKNKPPANPM